MKEINEFEMWYISDLVKEKIIDLENLLKENISEASRNYLEYNLGVYKKIIEKIGGKERCLEKKVQKKY